MKIFKISIKFYGIFKILPVFNLFCLLTSWSCKTSDQLRPNAMRPVTQHQGLVSVLTGGSGSSSLKGQRITARLIDPPTIASNEHLAPYLGHFILGNSRVQFVIIGRQAGVSRKSLNLLLASFRYEHAEWVSHKRLLPVSFDLGADSTSMELVGTYFDWSASHDAGYILLEVATGEGQHLFVTATLRSHQDDLTFIAMPRVNAANYSKNRWKMRLLMPKVDQLYLDNHWALNSNDSQGGWSIGRQVHQIFGISAAVGFEKQPIDVSLDALQMRSSLGEPLMFSIHSENKSLSQIKDYALASAQCSKSLSSVNPVPPGRMIKKISETLRCVERHLNFEAISKVFEFPEDLPDVEGGAQNHLIALYQGEKRELVGGIVGTYDGQVRAVLKADRKYFWGIWGHPETHPIPMFETKVAGAKFDIDPLPPIEVSHEELIDIHVIISSKSVASLKGSQTKVRTGDGGPRFLLWEERPADTQSSPWLKAVEGGSRLKQNLWFVHTETPEFLVPVNTRGELVFYELNTGQLCRLQIKTNPAHFAQNYECRLEQQQLIAFEYEALANMPMSEVYGDARVHSDSLSEWTQNIAESSIKIEVPIHGVSLHAFGVKIEDLLAWQQAEVVAPVADAVIGFAHFMRQRNPKVTYELNCPDLSVDWGIYLSYVREVQPQFIRAIGCPELEKGWSGVMRDLSRYRSFNGLPIQLTAVYPQEGDKRSSSLPHNVTELRAKSDGRPRIGWAQGGRGTARDLGAHKYFGQYVQVTEFPAFKVVSTSSSRQFEVNARLEIDHHRKFSSLELIVYNETSRVLKQPIKKRAKAQRKRVRLTLRSKERPRWLRFEVWGGKPSAKHKELLSSTRFYRVMDNSKVSRK
jgi:hypothetical protein